IYAVGGAGPENFADWFAASADGFGLGSALYKPGMTIPDIAARADDIVAAYDAARQP
ncbi:MAG: 2-dehydro-3-deoxy-6-phosphogalactonate aldolase, partial [Octadecabacter sp.]